MALNFFLTSTVSLYTYTHTQIYMLYGKENILTAERGRKIVSENFSTITIIFEVNRSAYHRFLLMGGYEMAIISLQAAFSDFLDYISNQQSNHQAQSHHLSPSRLLTFRLPIKERKISSYPCFGKMRHFPDLNTHLFCRSCSPSDVHLIWRLPSSLLEKEAHIIMA